MQDLAFIFFLATFVEGLVEYLFGKVAAVQAYLAYIALALGVVASIAYQIDIPTLLGAHASFGLVNYIVSGLIIGRGSNYVNDIISKFRATPTA